MKKIALIVAGGVLLASCNSSSNTAEETKDTTAATAPVVEAAPAPNTLTEQEKADGWALLFDGNTKNGWHIYHNGSDGSAWKVADGALYLDTASKVDFQTKGGGDLISDSTFENFHFSVEWKISPKGNSGIMFGVSEDKKYKYSFYTGPEMQVLDNDGHDDGKIPKHRAANLYDLIAASSEPTKPVGEWNKAEIQLNNGKLDFYLNGQNVVSTTMWDDAWKKLVKGSKFKEWPAFGTVKNGHFALQDHGNMVWYRNIKIKKL